MSWSRPARGWLMRRWTRSIGRWAVAVLAWVGPAAAQQPGALQLSWHAPPECPSEADVRTEAMRVLDGVSAPRAPLGAQADIERHGELYVLTLRTSFDGRHGERRLQAHDCRDLVQSVTLVLGLLVDAVEAPPGTEPGATEERQAQPIVAEAALARQPPPGPTPEAEGAPEAPSRSAEARGAVALTLGAAMQFALMPELAVALQGGVEFAMGPVVLGAQLAGWLPREQRLAPGFAMHTGGVGGSIRVCGRGLWGVADLGVCGGGRAAALRGRTEGLRGDGGSAVAPWYGLFLGADATWPHTTPLGLRLWGEAAVSMVRPRFVVTGLGQAHRVPPVVGQLGLAMVWRP